MITFKIDGKKRKELSPKAEERISSCLAAIERANPNIRWSNFEAHLRIRFFARFRLFTQLFSFKKVFIDIKKVRQEEDTIIIPKEVFGMEYKKRPIRTLTYVIRLQDLVVSKKKKTFIIKTEGE